MSDKQKDKLVTEALLDRFQTQRLSRILDIKDKVDKGEKLDKYEMMFLDEVFSDARQNEHYIELADDKLKLLCSKVLCLCREITSKALDNEKS